MRKILSKNPALIVMSWFAVVAVIAALLTSCAGGHYVQCDAYGKNDVKDHMDLKSNYKIKVTSDSRESFLAIIK